MSFELVVALICAIIALAIVALALAFWDPPEDETPIY